MTSRTTAQSNRFHALLTQRKLDEADKRELVKSYTNGREVSSSKMTVDEMAAAIKHLESDVEKSMKKMQAKIINIFRDIINHPNPNKLEQAHWDALNTFLKKKFKAPLHKLDYEGLRNACTGIEGWRDTEMRKFFDSLLNTH